MAIFQQRRAIGDAHERHVAEQLIERGWEVDLWGQGLLSRALQRVLQRTDSSHQPHHSLDEPLEVAVRTVADVLEGVQQDHRHDAFVRRRLGELPGQQVRVEGQRLEVRLRGARTCCWYHGGDWHTINAMPLQVLERARAQSVGPEDMEEFAEAIEGGSGVRDLHRPDR